ncbi:MAG: hypothetical protein FJY36_02510 [Betaproteobacteria bacterium]|nr:hypothetical protein [Betaproteobacteria bacterium]
MTSAHDTLDDLLAQLDACSQGTLGVAQLSQHWRTGAARLPLPPRYGEVLGHWLDRLEAGALFAEESCSFSQKDLLQGLRSWADKARQALNS